jgi:hypothetical protein
MKTAMIFTLNAVIAVGYAIAFFVAASPLLAVYGITPNQEGVYMARWFGLGLLAIGLTTWLARNETDSTAGRAICPALVYLLSYWCGVGHLGDTLRPVERAGLACGRI